MQDVWLNYKDPAYPEYPTEKNMDMVVKIVEASSRPGDVVLDAFGGSGTTAVASETTGRRWIYIDESPCGRQGRAAEVIKAEVAPALLPSQRHPC